LRGQDDVFLQQGEPDATQAPSANFPDPPATLLGLDGVDLRREPTSPPPAWTSAWTSCPNRDDDACRKV
jgi:hypothetical protein